MAWQDDVRAKAAELGVDVSSGYRTPDHNRRVGGAEGSYHTRGSQSYPGAIDVAGPADKLAELFRYLRQAFVGRINELYLNIPGGQSVAIKGNRYLGTNPEAGRPQHLHIAIGGDGPPASRIPPENRTAKGWEASGEPPPAGYCERQFCHPTAKSLAGLGEERCVCWSDVWAYGAALLLILGGGAMVFLKGQSD